MTPLALNINGTPLGPHPDSFVPNFKWASLNADGAVGVPDLEKILEPFNLGVNAIELGGAVLKGEPGKAFLALSSIAEQFLQKAKLAMPSMPKVDLDELLDQDMDMETTMSFAPSPRG